MEKVNVILSDTYLSGYYSILENISNLTKKNKDEKIILVVPDKFSLNAEQLFFEKMKVSSTFNVSMTTLSRLVQSILEEQGISEKILSKNAGTMLISQIILKNADKFTTYNKVSHDYLLAETLFNAINLLKSSGIKPQEIKQNISSTTFGQKMNDIYLIYNEYEKALKDNLDTISRLELFDREVKNSEIIKNSNIFFAMFDNYPNAQISTICALAKLAKTFTISLCARTSGNNYYVYDNVVFQRVLDQMKNEGIKYNKVKVRASLNKTQEHILNNLFSMDECVKSNTDKIELVKCDNIEQEANYVASSIKRLVLKDGYSLDDINVAVCGINDYSLILKKVLAEYDLPYYMQTERNLTQHYLTKTLIKIFKVVTGKADKIDMISIVKSPLFDIEDEKKETFETFCNRFNLFSKDFLTKFEICDTDESKIAEEVRSNVFTKIGELINKAKESSTVDQYICLIKDYLQSIDAERIIAEKAENENDLVERKIDQEVYNKFMDAIGEASDVFGNEQISIEFFFKMITSELAGVNLISIPIKCDAIYVGDSAESTFYPRKIMFIMGASQGRMPSYRVDYGMITDAEINEFKGKQFITPTIREINKREKFKMFNLCLTGTDFLNMSYSLQLNGETQSASEFITALQKIFLKDDKPFNVEKYQEIRTTKIKDNIEDSAFAIGSSLNAIKLAKGNNDDGALLRGIINSTLKEYLSLQEQEYKDRVERCVIQNAKKYLFPNNLTKVSQIEDYFACPFKQFIKYGIAPIKKPYFDVKANDIGNILHYVAEEFVNDYIKNNFKDTDIERNVKRYLQEILNSNEYINLKKNHFFVSSIEKESIRFCEALKYQIDSSEYKPKATEYRFKDYQLNNGLTLKGFIDRLDVLDPLKKFRIIDYKTGNEKFSFTEIYYGIKVQLYVYAKVIEDLTGMKPGQIVYMPVKNSFNKVGKDAMSIYKLNGLTLEDEENFVKLDKNLLVNDTSQIFSFKRSSTGVYAYAKKNMLNDLEFNKLFNYCFEIINKALDEMISGYITPKPYRRSEDTSCDNCPLKPLCHFNNKDFRIIETKEKSIFTGRKDERD